MSTHSGTAAASERVDADALVISLFRHEAPSLVRMARLFTDDRSAAEDIVQEAFVRLHRSAGRIRDLDRATPYLRSIVLNLARDHNRRGLLSHRHSTYMASPAEAMSFEDEAIAHADNAAIMTALRDLPKRQRDCLVLRYYLELSERETAATLGISRSSVKTHCRRGLHALTPVLQEPT